MSKNQITLTEKKQLEAQLDEILLVKKPENIKRLQIARSYGDLSENSEYDAASDEQREIDFEIQRLQTLINESEIIDVDAFDIDKVSIGKTISVHMGDVDQDETFNIVGGSMADIFKNNISVESPFGQAVKNKSVGDKATVHAINGDYIVEILSVNKTN